MSLRGSEEGGLNEEAAVLTKEPRRVELEDCFHGFITKREAEARLLDNGVEGSLLIRAEPTSSLSKQKYCISWLSPSHHSVLHYPVTLICGDYFLFGRRFASLSDLLEDFINRSDAIVTPFRPPSPVELTNRQRIATLPFCAMDDSDELTFREGDLLTEIQQVDEQWIWARLERTFQCGLVATDLTVPLNDERVPAEELPYFFDENLEILARRLMEAGVGSYLLRRSQRSSKDGFALMVNSGERIEKFLITRTKAGAFEVGGRLFPTVPDIVDRYSRREIRDGIKLVRAVVSAEGSNPLIKDMIASKTPLLRLHSYTSCPHFLAHGKALRQHKEDKWKPCFMMLSDVNGPELYVFDSEKRAKPRVVFELLYCFFAVIDESVVERANCFCVALNCVDLQPSMHLAVDHHARFLEWISLLRRRCLGRKNSAPLSVITPLITGINGFRVSSFIYLTLIGYRGPYVKLDYNYYTVVFVNGTRVRRTRHMVPSLKATLNYDVVYLLEDIPLGPCLVQLQLWAQSRTKTRLQMIKDNCFREVATEFTLKDDDQSELCACAEDSFDGFVFRAVRHRLVVLPEEQYSSFFTLLTSHNFLLPQWATSVMNAFNRDYFLQLLISVFLSSYSIYFSFLDALLDTQLGNENEMSLFRPDSFCTKCISLALRSLGRDVFVEEMSEVMQPFRADKIIVFDSDDFCKALWGMCRQLPPIFIATLSRIATATRARFPESGRCASLRAVNNFFMLRFVNPIVTLWSGLGPSARHLAKSVQMTANQVCSADFNPETASRGSVCMAKVLDLFLESPNVVEDIPNLYSSYRKDEHLAMLAFLVAHVVEQRPDCPVPEAAAVIRLLTAHAERFLNST